MNFYNPYYYSMPLNYVQPKVGLLGRLFGNTGVALSNFLNGTQRVLNIANQTIPLVKQVRPMIGNAKSMFKVMNEFKRVDKKLDSTNKIDNSINNDTKIIQTVKENSVNTSGPTFFA